MNQEYKTGWVGHDKSRMTTSESACGHKDSNTNLEAGEYSASLKNRSKRQVEGVRSMISSRQT